ncbi:MAG: hypothetical protein PUD50_09730, partial [Eubacteriales bacterium]|nr:hypothetical protein [Eubacteriales bacterium]
MADVISALPAGPAAYHGAKTPMFICVACSNGQFPVQSWQRLKERKLSRMLNENIKAIRKSKGLSQEELAVKLH